MVRKARRLSARGSHSPRFDPLLRPQGFGSRRRAHAHQGQGLFGTDRRRGAEDVLLLQPHGGRAISYGHAAVNPRSHPRNPAPADEGTAVQSRPGAQLNRKSLRLFLPERRLQVLPAQDGDDDVGLASEASLLTFRPRARSIRAQSDPTSPESWI